MSNKRELVFWATPDVAEEMSILGKYMQYEDESGFACDDARHKECIEENRAWTHCDALSPKRAKKLCRRYKLTLEEVEEKNDEN